MSEADATAEITRMARKMQESIGQFAGLEQLLRSSLPRLADPSRDAEFNAAVKALVEQLTTVVPPSDPGPGHHPPHLIAPRSRHSPTYTNGAQ